MKQVSHNASRLIRHARHLMMLVKIEAQKAFEFLLLTLDCGAECNQWWCRPHIGNVAGGACFDIFCGLACEVHYQRTDHAPHGFMYQPSLVDSWMFAAHLFHVARKNRDPGELLDRQQSGPQAIVDVMVVVRNLIGQIRELRFERRSLPFHEALADIAEQARILQRAVLALL